MPEPVEWDGLFLVSLLFFLLFSSFPFIFTVYPGYPSCLPPYLYFASAQGPQLYKHIPEQSYVLTIQHENRFEAFDEPWKSVFNEPELNKEWEDKWGLMGPDRALKSGLKIPDCGGKTAT